MEFDVSGIHPEARRLVMDACRVYSVRLGPALRSVVAHGSVVKGGFVRGGSDVDLVLLVDPTASGPDGRLPFPLAAAITSDMAAFDPAPFRYLQGSVWFGLDDDKVGFIPGAHHVVYGERDIPLVTAEQLLASAHAALRSLDPVQRAGRIADRLLSVGEQRLYREARLLTTDVWPALRHLLSLRTGRPLDIWRLPNPELVTLADPLTPAGRAIQQYNDEMTTHYAVGETVQTALRMLESGLAFLSAAADEYEAGQPRHGRDSPAQATDRG